MENYRLLIRICSNGSMTCDVPMVYSMRLLRLYLYIYIYGVEPPKFMKLPLIHLLLHKASLHDCDFFLHPRP